MNKRRLLWGVLIAAVLLTLSAGVGPDRARAIRHRRPAAGFNGDGRADLVVGVPGEDLTPFNAGAVNVLHGASPEGLNAAGSQFWNQDSAGISGAPEADDWFGSALATGDFDRDGYLDLAIGVPGEDLTGKANAGVVHILYGSRDSLAADGDQLWSQDSPDVEDTAEAGDQFGYSLAVGDFNGDGFDDLAIGVPYEAVAGVDSAGSVNILYGSADGLSAAGDQLWNQASPGIIEDAEPGDTFGYALVSGDFNGDGFDDLAVGVPSEGVAGIVDAGAVNIVYGSSTGLSATGNRFWSQGSPFVSGDLEPWDAFGSALAVGDFDGDGFDDLAIGVPLEALVGGGGAGSVNILYGSANGLSAAGSQLWSQDSAGIAGVGEQDDEFGHALAAGDFNGDGFDDLAIGVPFESTSVDRAGVVHVLYGSADRLSATGSQLWGQDSPDVVDSAQAGDLFGSALAAGDFNRDGFDDLAIGVPYEDAGGVQDAGGINILYGSAAKLSASGNQFWSQATPGIIDSPEAGDHFGIVLAAARARDLVWYLPNVVH